MGDRLNDIQQTQGQLRVGRTGVFDLIRKRELLAVRIGRRTLIPQSEIDKFIARRIQESKGGAA